MEKMTNNHDLLESQRAHMKCQIISTLGILLLKQKNTTNKKNPNQPRRWKVMRRFKEVLLLDICRLDLKTRMDSKEDTEHRVSVPASCSTKGREKNRP